MSDLGIMRIVAWLVVIVWDVIHVETGYQIAGELS